MSSTRQPARAPAPRHRLAASSRPLVPSVSRAPLRKGVPVDRRQVLLAPTAAKPKQPVDRHQVLLAPQPSGAKPQVDRHQVLLAPQPATGGIVTSPVKAAPLASTRAVRVVPLKSATPAKVATTSPLKTQVAQPLMAANPRALEKTIPTSKGGSWCKPPHPDPKPCPKPEPKPCPVKPPKRRKVPCGPSSSPPKPHPQPPSPCPAPCEGKPCCSKVAFFGLAGDPLDLANTTQYIDRAREHYPVADLVYEYYEGLPPAPANPPFAPEEELSPSEALLLANESYDAATEYVQETLQPAVCGIEERVRALVADGFDYIGLPVISSLLEPFITGTYTIYQPVDDFEAIYVENGGDLSDPALYQELTVQLECCDVELKPLDVRYSGVNFFVTNSGAPSIPLFGNLWRFFDIDSFGTPGSIAIAFSELNLVSGGAPNPATSLFFLSDAPGSVADSFIDDYRDEADALGVSYTNYFIPPVAGPDNSVEYDPAQLLALATALVAAAADPGSEVVLGISYLFSVESTDALAQGLNDAIAEAIANQSEITQEEFEARLTILGINWGPANVPIPYPVYVGVVPVDAIPSPDLACIGLPRDYCTFGQFVSTLNLANVEAFVWAATCRKSPGVLGYPLDFIGNSQVAYWLATIITPPGYTESNPIFAPQRNFTPNARWSGSQEAIPACLIATEGLDA